MGHFLGASSLALAVLLLVLCMLVYREDLRNRLIRLSMDTANVADDLLTQMFHNSRKQAAAAATPAMTEESLGQ